MKLYNIIGALLISVSLYAADGSEAKKEAFSYSDIEVNSIFSLYAAKLENPYFQESNAYSAGFLLHDKNGSDLQFGFGYMQPAWQIDTLFLPATQQPGNQHKDEGMLFFMNYNF